LETFGLATVKKTPPKLHYADRQPMADERTLEALITNRYEVMAGFARQLQTALKQEIAAMPKLPADAVVSAAKRWMHRDEVQVPVQFHALLQQARDALPNVDTMVRMREELRQMWLNTNASRAQLALELQQWCLRAEQSGVVALRDFSMQLRAVRL
jgi:stearoyl-CoA desaturase (delta-9 desaturase)